LREYGWLTKLDGQTRTEEIGQLLQIEPEVATELLQRLQAAKLIFFSEVPVKLVIATNQPAYVENPKIEWTQFGQLRIPISSARDIVAKLSSITLLRNPVFLGVTICWAILGFAIGVRLLAVEPMRAVLQRVAHHPLSIVAIIALILLTTVVHEFGHAVTCAAMGAPVRSMGVMIFYLQPAAYADVTDSWVLSNKWHRVIISAAGVYVQSIATAAATTAAMVLRAHGIKSDLLLVYISLNVGSIIFNLIPFIKLDGYWMLSSGLAIPNLRDRAAEWLRVSMLSLVTRRPVDPKLLRYNAVLQMTPQGRGLLACFGISSNLFGVGMWLAGISFLFRLGRLMGLRGGRQIGVVVGFIAFGVAVFGIKLWVGRRRATRAKSAPPVPAAGPVVTVTHDIDRTRPVQINPYAITMENINETLTFGWASADPVTVPRTQTIVRVSENLRSAITLNELDSAMNGLDSQTEGVLQELWHKKYLRYSAEWEVAEEEERYARTLGWLSLNVKVRGSERSVLARLKGKSVTILGVGGVGSNLALNLAACGIGSLHLVDGDEIEASNLNRQLLFNLADIGRRKTEVVAEKIAQFNPSVKVRTTHRFLGGVQDVLEVIQGADLVVRSIDTPLDAQFWVNEACVQMGIASTSAGFMPLGAVIGPTVIPGVTACLACYFKEMPRMHRGAGPTVTPVVTISAGILANEIITYLGQIGEIRTASGMLMLEVPTFEMRFQAGARDPNCAVCGARKAVTA
jgi:molybdopterin/thiamine biosynthesis adenylyltransferase